VVGLCLCILQKQKEDENYQDLNIACDFSPPAQGNKDIVQLQEDLINEKADYQQDPDLKRLGNFHPLFVFVLATL
jgi:hypothetical protein